MREVARDRELRLKVSVELAIELQEVMAAFGKENGDHHRIFR